MLWGKHFKSVYEGSMVGSGVAVFAVWGYVIANMLPDADHGYVVTLNSRLLGAIFGEPKEAMDAAIQFLCSPDPESTTKTEEGRRIIQVAQFEYRVVNGQKYQAIRNAEDRRRQNREAQARHREKKKQMEDAQKAGKYAGKNPKVPHNPSPDDLGNTEPTETPPPQPPETV